MPFDAIPELHGVANQGQGWIVLPDSNYIYVMGDLMDDTATPGDTIVRPFFARFDYEGRLLAHRVLYDSLLGGEFRILTRPLIKTDSTILTYIDRKIPGCCYHACMIELDAQDGSILRYKWYPHPPARDSTHVGNYFSRDAKNNIVAYHYSGYDAIVHIRLIDTSFSLIKDVKVEKNDNDNVPRFIESLNDSTFLMVGNSFGQPTGQGTWTACNFFLMKVHSDGSIVSFKLAPNIDEEIALFTSPLSYTTLRKKDGSWIISGAIVRVLDHLGLYWDAIPISISVSSEFDTLHWITYFADVPYDTPQDYHVAAACWAQDSSGFVVLARNYKQAERSTSLTKIAPQGDTLWTRHFIPTGFQLDQLAWSNMEDIKSTPHNSYVMAGTFFDRDRWIRRPWLMHVDSMGCLIPGCDKLVGTDRDQTSIGAYFAFFPNPVSDFISLQYRGPSIHQGVYHVTIHAIQGQVLMSAKIDAYAKAQFILHLGNLPPGRYSLRFTDEHHTYSQSEMIIKV